MGETPSNATTCCICLDESLPVQRLACGCKSAWFHPDCCSQWITHSQYPYACPVCRRSVPMKTNYSFSYEAGLPQQHFWNCLGIFGIETTVCSIASMIMNVPIVGVFPVQSASILVCPFVLKSNHTYTYFLFHSTIMIFTKGVFIFLSRGDEEGLLLLRLLAYVHIFILYFLHYVQYQNRLYGYTPVDPFEPYAISRELRIAESLPPLGTIAESATDTLERNVPARATRSRNGSSRRRRQEGEH